MVIYLSKPIINKSDNQRIAINKIKQSYEEYNKETIVDADASPSGGCM